MPSENPPPPPQSPPASHHDGAFHRMHPSSLLFNIGRLAKTLLIPAILVIVLARGDRANLWFAIFFLPAVIHSIVRYFTLQYRMTDDDLTVREGLLFRNERHIKFARIQNVDLVQTPLQRVFGVAEVRLETAGGLKPEAVLRVLSLKVVEEIRERVFAHRAAPAVAADSAPAEAMPGQTDGEEVRKAARPQPAPRLLLTLNAREILTLGFMSNRGVALVAVAAGLAWEYGLWERLSEEANREYAAQMIARFDSPLGMTILALLAILALKALSVIWMILWFSNYRLERVGDDLRISSGLLTRRAATIPRHRIQRVTVRQTLAQSLINRATIRVSTAGGAIGDEGDEAAALSRRWFVPILPRGEAPRILAELREEVDLPTLEWKKLDRRANRRIYAKSLIVSLLLVLIASALIRPWGFTSAALFVPLGLWTARRQAAYIAYAPMPWGLAFRSGAWTRRLSVTYFDKMQVISLRQTPLDRRHNHASLHVDTAGLGAADHRLRIPFLNLEAAQQLHREYFDRTEQAEFRW